MEDSFALAELPPVRRVCARHFRQPSHTHLPMLIRDILTEERTLLGIRGTSKKRILEFLSRFIAEQVDTLEDSDIFTRLIARERLGSTGIGEGVAIPHCRIPGSTETVGAMVVLHDPIDFDAADKKPVDIIFVLLVPEEANDQHLETLKELACRFKQPTFRDKLRNSEDQKQLFDAMVDYSNI